MIRHSIVAAVFVALAASSSCFAESLVITYRSGKTQTVPLEESSTAISSWQFVGGAAVAAPQPSQPAAQTEQPMPAAQKKTEEAAKPAAKTTEKSGVRVQWNAKPLSD
jgi:hypothetical protein